MTSEGTELLRENISFFNEDVQAFIDKTDSQVSNFSVQKEISRCSIERFFASLKNILQEKEQELCSKNDKLHDKLLADSKRRNEKAISISIGVRKLQGDVESGANAQMLQGQYDGLQSAFADIQLNSPVIQFDEIPGDEDTLKRLAFAKLTMETEAGGAFGNEEDRRHGHRTEIHTKLSSDMFVSSITSLIWHENRFIITDKGNKMVKVFTEDGELIDKLFISEAAPYDICFTRETANGNQFFVTAPKRATILQLAEKTPGVLTKMGSFTTHVGYAGIAKGVKGETLIVSLVATTEISRIDIIGYKGEIYRTFSANAYGQPLFILPRYVITNLNTIIVSDLKRKCVVFLNEANGSVLAEYHGSHEHPLVGPYDLTVDKKGFVYVVDGTNGNVHIIDLQCKQHDVILGVANGARLMCLDTEEGNIAVSFEVEFVKTAPLATLKRASDANRPTPTAPAVSKNHDNLLSPPPYDRAVLCPSPGF